MSEEERQAIIHLLDKQARYEYAINNDLSFNDEDYEAYIIRQSMIEKDKEIEILNNIINEINNAFEDKNIHNNMELVRKIKNILKGVDKE